MKTLLKYDITLQWRQGFWLVYLIVTFIYLIIVFNVPKESRLMPSLLFILSDTSVLGVMFVGALILLEKQQNVLQTLFVTPLSIRHYLISKTVSLSLISISMSVVLYLLPNGFDFYFLAILLIVMANAFIFTLIGTGISLKVNTINQYIFLLVVSSLVIILPTIPFLLLDHPAWLIVFPLNAAIDILLLKIHSIPLWRSILDIFILLCWVFIAFYYANTQFTKFLHKG